MSQPYVCESWAEYEELRAAWLSRLMFGWLPGMPVAMPAGECPLPPDEDEA